MPRKATKHWVSTLVLLLTASVSAYAQGSPKEQNVVTFGLGIHGTAGGIITDDPSRGTTASGIFESSPWVNFTQRRRRGFWSVDYRPTLREYSAFSTQDRFDHQLRFDAEYQFSKRWSVEFRQRLLHSTNPFLRVAEDNPSDISPGDVLFGPNRGFVGPEQRFTQLSSQVTFRYQLGRHSQLEFGGDYFREDQALNPLFDQETRNLRAGYQKKYARNKGFAVLYSLQHFRLAAAHQRVRSHSILFFHNYEFRPGTQLTLFAGPQFSLLRARPSVELDFLFFRLTLNLSVREPSQRLALGGLFSHRLNDRTGLNFSVAQRVAEGEGLLGAVRQRAARLNLQRRLRRRLWTSLSAYYTDNRSLAGFGANSNFKTWGVSTDLRYELSRRVDFRASYEFSHFGSGLEPLRSLLTRNRFTIGFDYSFGSFSVGR